jgi:hypothetical protein
VNITAKIQDREYSELFTFAVLNKGNCLGSGRRYYFFAAFFFAAFFFAFFLGSPPLIDPAMLSFPFC